MASLRRTRVSVRALARGAVTVVAGLVVWVALVAPEGGTPLSPATFIRIPVEGLILVGLVLVLPPRARRWVEVLVGVALGVLLLIRILDIGFHAALYRPFNPVTDWRYAGSLRGLLGDWIGPVAAPLLLAALGISAVAILIGLPMAVRRLARIVDRHRVGSARAVAALTVAWIACAAIGVRLVPDTLVASWAPTSIAYHEVSTVPADLLDRTAFTKAIGDDRFQDLTGTGLLGALRGKDVAFVFVESYGKVAIEGSPAVDTALRTGTSRLEAAGYSSRSAWLTSPTFGGISWLAHSTLQSGLWVDTQQRYDQLVRTDRFTLSRAFARAGWRTVDVVPANRRDWPEGALFYGYDTIYDARSLGYAGPSFGYATMPDQYTLSAFNRLELDRKGRPDRPPVMAEIDLVSSHVPWAPLPRLIDWDAIGDGSIYARMLAGAIPEESVWRSASGIRAAYGQSIAYSLGSVVSFARETRGDDLVLVVLGDHQPAGVVSGPNASHDVPITIIARDPAVLDRISGWGWHDGLRPGPKSPVWPMDAFRDRFLLAYGSIPGDNDGPSEGPP